MLFHDQYSMSQKKSAKFSVKVKGSSPDPVLINLNFQQIKYLVYV